MSTHGSFLTSGADLYVRRKKGRLCLYVEHRSQPSSGTFGLYLNTDNHAIALIADVADHDDEAKSLTESTAQNREPRERVIEALKRFQEPVRLRRLRDICRMRAESLSNVLHELVESAEVTRTDDGWILANRIKDAEPEKHTGRKRQLHIPI